MAQPVATFDLRGSTAAPAPQSHSHAHDGHAHAHGAQEHGHTHEHMDHPGKFTARELPNYEGRDWDERAFTIGAPTRLSLRLTKQASADPWAPGRCVQWARIAADRARRL